MKRRREEGRNEYGLRGERREERGERRGWLGRVNRREGSEEEREEGRNEYGLRGERRETGMVREGKQKGGK